jgi:tetratricopeptide (TPR) repeat protein
MYLTPNSSFDIFISYNWEIKDQVKLLYHKLTNNLGFKVWLDDKQLDSSILYEQLVNGIKKSALFLCCVTKKYTQSDNCIREITFASDSKKPIVVLMFQDLPINELGSVGFIIGPLLRHNCFSDINIFHSWSGDCFNSILKSINSLLNKRSNSAPNLHKNLVEASDEDLLNEINKKDRAHSLYSKALNDIQNRIYTGALCKLNQAIQLNPKEKNYLYLLGETLNKMQKYEEAIFALDKCLKLDSNFLNAKLEKAWALNELGNQAYESDRFNLALMKYNEAIELTPNNKTYLVNRAGALVYLEKYNEALESANQALKISPDYTKAKEKKASALNAIAITESDSGNHNKALKLFSEAISLNPKQKVFYVNISDSLINLRRYDEAIENLQKALSLDPYYQSAKNRLTTAFKLKKN